MNIGAVLYGREDLRLEPRPCSSPGPGEVLVRLACCGLCGTDITLWKHGECGDFEVKEPFAIGHESSGVVEEVGCDVTKFQSGDRVALELGEPCLKCSLCRAGSYNLCKPFSSGGLQQLIVHPAHLLHRLPAGVSLEAGALLEPLAVGVRAARRAGVGLSCRVLVTGAGPIGLACLLASLARGASQVVLADVAESRLSLAANMGATSCCHVDPTLSPRDLSEIMLSATRGPVDVVIDTCGVPVTMAAAMLSLKRGGVFTPVALEPPGAILPMHVAIMRGELDLRGSFSYTSEDYQTALAMVEAGYSPLPMISHQYPLKDTLTAFDTVRRGGRDVVKVLVNCDK